MKKNIKKVLALIFVFAVLAGCSAKEQAKDVTEVKNTVESAVNISDYITGAREDGTYYYALTGDAYKDYELKYSAVIGKDTVFLPISYGIFKSLGWEFKNEEYRNIELKPSASTNVISVKDGKEIMVFIKNTNEDNIKCINGTVCRVIINFYSKEDGYKSELPAPGFKIDNGITESSNLEEIIAAVGEPNEITYTPVDGKCAEITVMYKNSNNDWLKFVLAPDGSKIFAVDYSYGY